MDISSTLVDKLPQKLNINLQVQSAWENEWNFQNSIHKVKGIFSTTEIISLTLIKNYTSLVSLVLILPEEPEYYGIFENLIYLRELELIGESTDV